MQRKIPSLNFLAVLIVNLWLLLEAPKSDHKRAHQNQFQINEKLGPLGLSYTDKSFLKLANHLKIKQFVFVKPAKMAEQEFEKALSVHKQILKKNGLSMAAVLKPDEQQLEKKDSSLVVATHRDQYIWATQSGCVAVRTTENLKETNIRKLTENRTKKCGGKKLLNYFCLFFFRKRSIRRSNRTQSVF